jgi:hypothetical protein
MSSRALIFAGALALVSCVRMSQRFMAPTENDTSVIFPLSIGRALVEVDARHATYDLEGDVLQALLIASNDYLPLGVAPSSCSTRLDALDYRFTRRDDIIFVYVNEDFTCCGADTLRPIHSGAKYAIHTDGRILRRVIDGVDDDHSVWRLGTPDGGTVTVVTEPGVLLDPRHLDAPDSGVLKVVTEPVDMPGVLVLERLEAFQPAPEGPENALGASSMPFDAGTGAEDGGATGAPDATSLEP